ncbi:MAG: V-type ATPase subunit, partial [Clostridia bacterium]|nr:V-type ATPase subunit [Clostridia bacterium]
MGNEYSAIAAKLRAMHARFLTEKDYEALLAGKSVNDICAYLKNTDGYSDVLENVNEREIHRGVMELLLEQDIMEEYVRLYNFADRPLRRLLNFWFIQREGEFIKRELRHIYTKEARTRDEVSQGRF